MSQIFKSFQDFKKRYPIKVNDEMLLGSGTYGKVIKVEDQVETEWIAIKIGEYKGEESKSLKAEVELAQSLPRHPNIARYDACYRFETEMGVSDFALMKYYQDGNLAMLMRESSTLGPVQIKEIVMGILLGLQHLHSNRIVHRDFKPANILISRDNRGRFIPKIADFGLSKLVREDEIDSSDFDLSDGRGTPSYKAPEQIEGGRVSFNIDLWALGVILYELMTGEKPFSTGFKLATEASLKREIERRIISVEIPARINEIEEPYQSMIRRCLIKDIKLRARNESELIDLFEGIDALLLEAKQLYKNQEYDKAIAKFEAVLEKREHNEAALKGIELCQLDLKKQEIKTTIFEAQQLLKEAKISQAKQKANKANDLIKDLENQNVAIDSKKKTELNQIMVACQQEEQHLKGDTLIKEAQQAQKNQKYDLAISKLHEVLNLEPNNTNALEVLKAVKEAQKRILITGILNEADTYFKKKKFELAKDKYQQILGLEKNNIAAQKGMAACIAVLVPKHISEEIELPTDQIFEIEEKTDLAQKDEKFVKQNNPTVVSTSNTSEQVSDEMRERVDKVKLAIKKAKLEKPDVTLSSEDKYPTKNYPKDTHTTESTIQPAKKTFITRFWPYIAGATLIGSGLGWNQWHTQSSSMPEEIVVVDSTKTTKTIDLPPPINTNEDDAANNYSKHIKAANKAIKSQNWEMAYYYINAALQAEPTSKEAKKLKNEVASLEKKQKAANDLANQNRIAAEAAAAELANIQTLQADYEDLLDKGLVAANNNNKTAAIGFFNNARSLASSHNLSSNKISNAYNLYFEKGNKFLKLEEYEGAKAWFLVAQSIKPTTEISKKIRECNANL